MLIKMPAAGFLDLIKFLYGLLGRGKGTEKLLTITSHQSSYQKGSKPNFAAFPFVVRAGQQ
jgi:hypothetical protein